MECGEIRFPKTCGRIIMHDRSQCETRSVQFEVSPINTVVCCFPTPYSLSGAGTEQVGFNHTWVHWAKMGE